MKWIFNNNYHDYQQVEQFYALFTKTHDDLTTNGKYAYNACFKGILGIDDEKQEDIAIYILQQSKTEKDRERKIKELEKEGFKHITNGEGYRKYTKIIQIGTSYSRASTKEFEEAKIVFKDGLPYGILPKGKRSRGYRILDELLLAK